ncbi:putative disease resistance protein At3g14460 [Cannabis sativa]|uniref:putative disease resistance protein At3g14460 n=1 Tax=Cannabis sativa TaxID=3483 RepID=UPI0029CA81B7|nr:putative disease resistance protein At3g14460 [Cannabis sativa]
MAEGLLQPQKGKRIEDVGEEYWNALISKSFFQRNNTWNLNISMHDLMHDLAMHISGQSCFIYDSCNDSGKLITNSKIRHLSYMKDLKDTIEFDNFSRVKHLRTLLALPLRHIWRSLETQFKLEMVLKDGGCLKTLSLSQSHITNLPDSIGNLKQLRYLDVSGTKIKELPLSICELYNLETLLLMYCNDLTQLPTNISNSINLRHLVTRWTRLKEMPPNICNMTNLQRLSDFVLCKSGGSRIKELGKLENLHGSLHVSGLSYVNDVSDVLEGELRNKKYLDELILSWNGTKDNSTKEKEVLNALQPHVNLKKLEIIGYNGTSLPDWQFDLKRCGKLNVALPGCNFPSLEVINVVHCDEMVTIFPTSTHIDSAYSSLKTLSINNCSRLETFSVMGLPPSLRSLYITSCDMLVDNRMKWNLQSLPSLNDLDLCRCEVVVDSFPEEWLLPPSLKALKVFNCNNLRALTPHLPSSIRTSIFGKAGVITTNRTASKY